MTRRLIMLLFVLTLMPAIPAVAQQTVSTAAGPILSTGQESITEATSRIVAAPASGRYRFSIAISNTGSKTVYIGGATVTAANGFPVAAGRTVTLDRSATAIYGICASGETSTIAYIEETK